MNLQPKPNPIALSSTSRRMSHTCSCITLRFACMKDQGSTADGELVSAEGDREWFAHRRQGKLSHHPSIVEENEWQVSAPMSLS